MAMFTKGRYSTIFLLIVAALVTALDASGFIYIFAKHYHLPTTTIKVVAALVMVTELLFFIFTLLSCHAINLNSKGIGFGLCSISGLGCACLEIWFFVLMCQKHGFRYACGGESKTCTHAKFLIALSTLIFISVIIRLHTIFVLWHFNITNLGGTVSGSRANPATPTAPSTIGTNSTASMKSGGTGGKLQSLPKFGFQRRHLRTGSSEIAWSSSGGGKAQKYDKVEAMEEGALDKASAPPVTPNSDRRDKDISDKTMMSKLFHMDRGMKEANSAEYYELSAVESESDNDNKVRSAVKRPPSGNTAGSDSDLTDSDADEIDLLGKTPKKI